MLGKKVFFKANYPQDAVENALNGIAFLLRVASRPDQCDKNMIAFACANTFLPCTDLEDGTVTSVTYPSKALCTSYTGSCASLLAIMPDAAVPASAPWLKPDCTDAASYLETGGNNYASDTTPDVPASMVTTVPTPPCPAPLVDLAPTDHQELSILGGPCALPCPMVMWTEDEYKITDDVADVATSISLVVSIFLTVTWIAFPQQRQKRYALYFILNLTAMNFVYWLGLRLRGDKTGAGSFCETNANEYHMKGYCLFQAMVMLYSVLGGIAWWMIQAVDLFLKVYLQKRFPKGSREETVKEYIFHGVAWGLPLACLVAALASEQLGGYAIGTNWCLFSQSRIGNADDLSWPFYYYPMVIMATICTATMIITAVSLCRANRAAARRATVTHRNGAPKINTGAFMRMFLFVVLMAIVWIFLLSYKLHTYIYRPDWAKSTEDFVVCLLVNQYVVPGLSCGDHPQDRLAFSMLVALVIITCIPSVLLFLLHGTTPDIYRAWAGLFYDKCGFKCCKKYSGKNLEIYDLSHSTTVAHQNATSQNGPSTAGGSTATPMSPADKSKRQLFGKNSTAWRQQSASVPSLNVSTTDGGQPGLASPTSQTGLNADDMPNNSSGSARPSAVSEPDSPAMVAASPGDIALVELAPADRGTRANTQSNQPTQTALPTRLPPHMRPSFSVGPGTTPAAASSGESSPGPQQRRYTPATPAAAPGGMMHPRARKSTQQQQPQGAAEPGAPGLLRTGSGPRVSSGQSRPYCTPSRHTHQQRRQRACSGSSFRAPAAPLGATAHTPHRFSRRTRSWTASCGWRCAPASPARGR